MRGLPAAPPAARFARHTPLPLASLARTPDARSARNQPRSAAKRPQLASVHPTRPPTSV